jgi:hypothetical protein
MRFVTFITMSPEGGNKAIKDGSMQRTMQQAIERWKPEGAYFTTIDGHRTAIMIVDLATPSQMVEFAEPMFMNLGAKVDYHPAMSPADLREGLGKMGHG